MRPRYLTIEELCGLADKADLICGAQADRGITYHCYTGKTPDEIAKNPVVTFHVQRSDNYHFSSTISAQWGPYSLGEHSETCSHIPSQYNMIVKKFYEIMERHKDELMKGRTSYFSDEAVQSQLDFARELLKR